MRLLATKLWRSAHRSVRKVPSAWNACAPLLLVKPSSATEEISAATSLAQLYRNMASSAVVMSPRIQLAERSPSAAGLRGTPFPDAMEHFRSIRSPINKYLALRDLFQDAPQSYFRLLYEHTEEILPYIYTPTVGEVCEQYHKLPLRPHGLYLRLTDKGHVLDKLKAWQQQQQQQQQVQVVVMTDGERILGLGDLGANGMGISEGKITLYTAAAGVDPSKCLPLCIDMGTNNKRLLEDPGYKGLRQHRVGQAEFDAFMGEVLGALQQWQPHLLVQFEDFGNSNAFRLLHDWRHRMCAFNDDIQGTASITLAGLLSAVRATGKPLQQHRVLFLGAGEAGTGIGELIATYMHLRGGMSLEQGRQHCYFMDSKGLVCASRDNLQHHKVPFAHDVPYCATLNEAIKALRPTAIVGVSTIAGAFDQEVVEAMCELNERPLIFPLSNPTSKSECTYQEAFKWSQGKVLFASGSPFDPLTHAGTTYFPAQANNAYIFPALGHAALLTRARELPDEAFVVAAEALADMTDMQDLAVGRLFPAVQDMRLVSLKVAAAVAQHLVATGVGSMPQDWNTSSSSRGSSPVGGESSAGRSSSPQGTAGAAAGGSGAVQDWMRYVGHHMWHPEPAAPLSRTGSLTAKL